MGDDYLITLKLPISNYDALYDNRDSDTAARIYFWLKIMFKQTFRDTSHD